MSPQWPKSDTAAFRGPKYLILDLHDEEESEVRDTMTEAREVALKMQDEHRDGEVIIYSLMPVARVGLTVIDLIHPPTQEES